MTHFWVHQEDGIYFESKGTHDHFRPQARRATPDRNSNNKVSSSQKGNSEQVENTEDKTEKQEVILIKCADKESHVRKLNIVHQSERQLGKFSLKEPCRVFNATNVLVTLNHVPKWVTREQSHAPKKALKTLSVSLVDLPSLFKIY